VFVALTNNLKRFCFLYYSRLSRALTIAEHLKNAVLKERVWHSSELRLIQDLEIYLNDHLESVREWTDFQNDIGHQEIPRLEDVLRTQLDAVAKHFPLIDPFGTRMQNLLDGSDETGEDEGILYDEYYLDKFSQMSRDAINCFDETNNLVENHCVSLAGCRDTYSACVEQKEVTVQDGVWLEERIWSELNIASAISTELNKRKEFIHDLRTHYQQVSYSCYTLVSGIWREEKIKRLL